MSEFNRVTDLLEDDNWQEFRHYCWLDFSSMEKGIMSYVGTWDGEDVYATVWEIDSVGYCYSEKEKLDGLIWAECFHLQIGGKVIIST